MPKQVTEKLPSGEQRGAVVSFDDEKGFGFIRPQGNLRGEADVFFHVRNVDGRQRLGPGRPVTYYVTRSDKGLAATKVHPGSRFSTPYVRYSLAGLASIILLLIGLAKAVNTNGVGVWLALWIVAVSTTAFGIYGYDKAQAGSDGLRVPEVVLHALSLLGGSPGVYAGMRVFHHKTAKRGFQAVFWLIVALQVAMAAFLIFSHRLPGIGL